MGGYNLYNKYNNKKTPPKKNPKPSTPNNDVLEDPIKEDPIKKNPKPSTPNNDVLEDQIKECFTMMLNIILLIKIKDKDKKILNSQTVNEILTIITLDLSNMNELTSRQNHLINSISKQTPKEEMKNITQMTNKFTEIIEKESKDKDFNTYKTEYNKKYQKEINKIKTTLIT